MPPGWPVAEVDKFLVTLSKELTDPRYRLMDTAYVAYGRKPFPGQAMS
jgi:hypothetical protein